MRISGKASKTLDSSWIILDDTRYDLFLQGNHFTGTFPIHEQHTAVIHLRDENDVSNSNPPNYRLNIIHDSPPEMIVQSPPHQFELDESDFIGFDIQISDDYGFSDAWIEYKVKAPDYLPQDTTLYKRHIPELQKDIKSQYIYHGWDLTNFLLAPEDELHIQIAIADNNNLHSEKFYKFVNEIPTVLLILCAPVWFRSSRLRNMRAPLQ